MWIGTIVCFSFYHLADSFITIWVGEQYILSHTTLIILSVTTFIDLTRTNDIFSLHMDYLKMFGPPLQKLY